MPLSAFPETFGLSELKKGFFKHLFNRPENQEYVGPIPDESFFMPETMSVKGRVEFDKWHAAQVKNKVIFDFSKEIIEYCESDVQLLKQGCLTFKRLFEKQAKFNPFDNIAIAAACNRDLRQNRMELNTIASEPLHGWRLKTNFSKVSLEWLHCPEQDLCTPIQHAGNQGEYRIPHTRYTVDGYDAATNTVYEFLGCFWHGCPDCFPNRAETHQRLEGRTFNDVYQCTKKRLQFLEDKGYTLVTIWECQWSNLKKEREEVKAFVDNLDIVDIVDPLEQCGETLPSGQSRPRRKIAVF